MAAQPLKDVAFHAIDVFDAGKLLGMVLRDLARVFPPHIAQHN